MSESSPSRFDGRRPPSTSSTVVFGRNFSPLPQHHNSLISLPHARLHIDNTTHEELEAENARLRRDNEVVRQKLSDAELWAKRADDEIVNLRMQLKRAER